MREVKQDSIWHKVQHVKPEELSRSALELISLEPEGSTSRFLTVVGKSDDANLNLLTAHTELEQFAARFKNDANDMSKLYGHLEDNICIAVLDKEAVNGPVPACVCRIAIGDSNSALPTLSVLEASKQKHGYHKRKHVWRVSKEEYQRGMSVVGSDGGEIFDVATIANLDDYKSGIASLQVFSAFARMYDRKYNGFNGRFLTTIVTDVADIVNITTGHDVLNIFPGTTPQEFYGAKNTSPHIGLILPDQYGEDMKKRMSTSDTQTDTQNSTYLFL